MPDITLILLFVVLAAFIFFQIRSGKKRQREAEERRSAMTVGTEVMTNFGLYGTITDIDEDENIAVLEVSPGVELRVHRQVLLKPAVDPVVDEPTDDGSTESGPQLNTSSAIPMAEAEYGERVDPDSDTDTKK